MSEEDGDHTQVTKAHLHVLLISRFAVPPTKKGSLSWWWWWYRWRNRSIFKAHEWIPVSIHPPSSLSQKVRFTFPKSSRKKLHLCSFQGLGFPFFNLKHIFIFIHSLILLLLDRSPIKTNFMSHALNCSQRICERVSYPYCFNDYRRAAAENNGIIKEGCFRWQEEDAGATGLVADDLYELKALECTVKESEFFKVQEGKEKQAFFCFSFLSAFEISLCLAFCLCPYSSQIFHRFLWHPSLFLLLSFGFLGDFVRLHGYVPYRNRTMLYS